MTIKRLAAAVLMLAFTSIVVFEAKNNIVGPPNGSTGAPGENTCAESGCHAGNPIPNSQFLTFDFFGGSIGTTEYTTGQTYSFSLNISDFNQSVYGFEITALDPQGNKAGSFSNISNTAIQTDGVTGREYIVQDSADGNNAWLFLWTAPSNYVGDVCFYVAALAGDGDGTVAGDITYTENFCLPPAQQGGNVTADFEGLPTNVCVGETVVFSSTSSGPVSTYDWNFGANATPPNATGAGPHFVSYTTAGNKDVSLVVTDGGGNADTTTKTGYITVSAGPTASVTPDTSICEGDSVELVASGGVEYQWNTGDTTAAITVSPSVTTVYDVVVRDATGCEDDTSVTVTVNPQPVATLPDTVYFCTGGSTLLDAGNAGASFSWSSGETSQTITVSTEDTYTVTVTETGGCEVIDSAVVIETAQIVIGLPDTVVLCPGQTVMLDAGNPGATFSWSPGGETTQTITVSTTGQYIVGVDAGGGCAGSDTTQVITAQGGNIVPAADDTICANESTVIGNPLSGVSSLQQLQGEDFNGCSQPTGWTTNIVSGPQDWFFTDNASGGNFTPAGSLDGSCMAWFDDDAAGGGAASSVVELFSPAVDVTGYAAVVLQFDWLYRHLGSSSFSVDVWDGSQWQNIIFADSDDPACAGSGFFPSCSPNNAVIDVSQYANANFQVRFTYDDGGGWNWYAAIDNFVLSVLPNGLFSWSPTTGLSNPTTPVTTASPDTTTTYLLTYDDGLGCPEYDTVTVTVNPPPTVTLDPLGGPYCADDNTPVTLNGQPTGGTFAGPGVSSGEFTAATAGPGNHLITYTYSDAIGCTSVDSQFVEVAPLPAVTIEDIYGYACLDELPIQLTGSPAGGTFAGQGITGSNTFDPGAAGTYDFYYTYADSLGCVDTAFRSVNVVANPVTFNPIGGPYCSDDLNSYPLSATPAGGQFSGPGVSGTDFLPSQAGAGVHDIYYVYDTSFGYTILEDCAYQVYNDTAPTFVSLDFFGSGGDDELSPALPIGFPFEFFGETYEHLQVSSNGFITFDTTNTFTALGNDFIPDTDQPDNLIAVMWDDLITPSFEYWVEGTAPNRRMVINFNTTYHFNDPADSVRAQVVLHEGTNIVDIICIDCNADASFASATQGVENADGTEAYATPGRNDTGWDSEFDCTRFVPEACEFSAVQQVEVTGININGAGPDTVLCQGNSLTLTAVGGTSFSWTPGGQTSYSITVSPTDTTLYTVTGLDSAGCSAIDSIWVFVVDAAPAQILNLDATYCTNQQPVALQGNLPMGSFSGTGVTNDTLDPSILPVGGPYTITYSGSDVNGCASSTTGQYSVLLATDASFSGLGAEYCLDNQAVTLTGSPAGGVFNGPGVSNNTFVPFFAGVGTHSITYTYTAPNGCPDTDTQQVTVHALPQVSFDPLMAEYCLLDEPVDLVVSPEGGNLFGTGVVDTVFDPSVAGAGGPYGIYYEYTDTNGCSRELSQFVDVNDAPSLSLVNVPDEFCIGDAAMTFTGLPAAGTFFGPGVGTANVFTPDSAGAGQHTIGFTYVDGNSCTDTLWKEITVHEKPAVSFSGLDNEYCLNADLQFLSGTPAGGTFSGLGVTGNVFSPLQAAVGGPYDITYTYTDTNGCTNTNVQQTTVLNIPPASITGLAGTYCAYETSVQFNTTPAGGTVYGPGIDGNVFNPSAVGPGSYNIVYEVTDSTSGCINVAAVTVTVDACTGVEEVLLSNDISLFPNPTSGMVVLQFDGDVPGNSMLDVFAVDGQRVMHQAMQNITGGHTEQLDMSNFAKGLYYVRLTNGDATVVKKLIVQ